MLEEKFVLHLRPKEVVFYEWRGLETSGRSEVMFTHRIQMKLHRRSELTAFGVPALGNFLTPSCSNVSLLNTENIILNFKVFTGY